MNGITWSKDFPTTHFKSPIEPANLSAFVRSGERATLSVPAKTHSFLPTLSSNLFALIVFKGFRRNNQRRTHASENNPLSHSI